MKSNQKPAKAAKKRPRKTAAKKKEEMVASSGDPLMTYSSQASSTRTRRNKAATIERTNRFQNIDDGLVPFNYSLTSGYGQPKNIDVKDAVILCQKAYYNYGIFRHTIDLMTEFSSNDIYLRGGSKRSRDFFESLFKKLDLWSIKDKFFREYYRSGNVFVYRFDAKLDKSGINKLTKTFGASKMGERKLPIQYIILNPADIQIGGNISFAANRYYKLLNGYELERLRNPRSDEDREMLENLPADVVKEIKNKAVTNVLVPLNPERITATFYKKQDYEPFAVPMGYPVLEDINWKAEMKKMDMAIARTMQQAVLLVTMGAEPEKGGINQKNLASMQKLFENESVGRVLIADYTTKAEFVIPNISMLLDSKKYEVVDRDIAMGLNNMLFGEDNKFANQALKLQVFMARLRQARMAFLNEFLQPEIKRVAKEIGLKNYPTAYFDDVSLSADPSITRIYARLIEVGVLTPEEGIMALETGRLPNHDESVESQETLRKLKDKGFYEPVMGGPETQLKLADKSADSQMELQDKNIVSQEKMSKEKAQQAAKAPSGSAPSKKAAKTSKAPSGRPSGTKAPQTTKNTPQSRAFLLSKVKGAFLEIEKLEKKVETQLLRKHKLKKLTDQQKAIVEDISKIIVANEDIKDWNAKKVKQYLEDPTDKNAERVEEIQGIAYEHQVDDYLASILYLSKADEEK